ncbi:MAG TPA: penicillin-binding transpeptidase domain-containing protein [Smithella sp.]|nr:penicillin-binding transpeptidase domain-containing protein [Smithella sp.]
MLGRAGVITPTMRDNALAVQLEGRKSLPELPAISFVGRKAANAIRRQLSGLLGVPQLYELDRLDLSVQSTLNGATQEAVTQLLCKLKDPGFVEESGLRRSRLLGSGNPADVIYSFTLYERVGNTNLLRIQTDNYDQPFDINEGVKIELGSTAKLRTLVTYLEIITELHQRYAGLPPEKLREIPIDEVDHLTRWTLEYLATKKDRSLSAMLEAAVERRYSASPGETFFTGGGEHVFHNFEKSDDSKIFSVREGFQKSVNLVFIRLMRDIVRYYMFNVPGSTAKVLADVKNPARQEYLARFADQEGQIFLNRFYKKYQGRQTEEQWEMLLQSMHHTPARLAAAFRFVKPEARLAEFSIFMNTRLPSHNFSAQELEKLYAAYGPERWDLQDRGYIIGIHPLELWLVAYLREHPHAASPEIMRKSAKERQEVYQWLFNTQSKNSQDIRIKSLLEVEAFLEIHRMWKKLGYPFDSLVPSYATAIGSSADRPASLAELVGIILNNGVQYPMARIEKIHFASKTPYETILRRKEVDGQKVLSSEIAAVLRSALVDVVEKGTAQQIRGAFTRSDGTPIAVGGKTGTGDNRYEIYGPKKQLMDSRVINRASVFVFFIGDRFFGTITAYVPGSQAADYGFTSSLPVQILKMMAPTLIPMIEHR